MAKPFPPYALRRHEPSHSGLIRVLKSMQKTARELADKPESQSSKTVHDLRTLIKRLRAYLWFLRPLCGKVRYRQSTTTLRNAARRLSGTRDLHAIDSALAQAATQEARESDARSLAHVSQSCAQDGERHPKIDAATLKRTADAIIRTIENLLKTMGRTIGDCPSPGCRLEKAFRQTRKAAKGALRGKNPRLVHEWRKKTKRLFYLLQLTSRIPKLEMVAALGRIDQLQETLGNFQDNIVAEKHLQRQSSGIDKTHLQRVSKLLQTNRKLLLKRARHCWHSIPQYR